MISYYVHCTCTALIKPECLHKFGIFDIVSATLL